MKNPLAGIILAPLKLMKPAVLLVCASYSAMGQADSNLYQSVDLKDIEVRGEAAATFISAKSATFVNTISKKELKKAACCNLSESFETNPSIDVSFTDAVTGTKQIMLFGLAGKYAHIQTELTPLVWGLLSNSGLSFIPGAWIESIQLTKGIGSALNGHESITGQINVELLKPDEMANDAIGPDAEGRGDILLNSYVNQGGRMEGNIAMGTNLNDQWSFGMLGHLSGRDIANDRNQDGFMDMPLGNQANVMLRSKYWGTNGLEGLFTLHGLTDEKRGGQGGSLFDSSPISQPWSNAINQDRLAFTAKTGWVSPNHNDLSIGVINHWYSQGLNGHFGSDADLLNKRTFNHTQQGGLTQVLVRAEVLEGQLYQTSGMVFNIDAYDMNQGRNGQGEYSGSWTETNLGAYSEWTYTPLESFTAVGGLRLDQHSIAGLQWSPRMHLRYAPTKLQTIRLSAGRGFRMALPMVESLGRLASNRNLTYAAYGNLMGGDMTTFESAWNAGVSYVYNFTYDYMPGSIAADAHWTVFDHAIVHDYWMPGQHMVYQESTYNGSPAKQSNSLGVTLNYKLNKSTDMRLAYRNQITEAKYWNNPSGETMAQLPFVAKHRGMASLSKAIKGGWELDATAQFYGPQSLPFGGWGAPTAFGSEQSPAFTLLSGQVRKAWKGGDIYLGIENALDVRQPNPISGAKDLAGNVLAADHADFTSSFDAIRIYGPIFGRNLYMGLNLIF